MRMHGDQVGQNRCQEKPQGAMHYSFAMGKPIEYLLCAKPQVTLELEWEREVGFGSC